MMAGSLQYSWFEGALGLEFLEKAVGYPMLAPALKTHCLRQAPLPHRVLWESPLRYTCLCNLFLQIFIKKKRGEEEGRKRNGRGKDKEW